MGDFKAGHWILGFAIYFFLFFVVTYASINYAQAENLNTGGLQMQDPGFQSQSNIPQGQTIGCTGSTNFFCGETPGATSESNCNTLQGYGTGCFWSNGSIVTASGCFGTINLPCANFTTPSICQAVGCTWNSFATTNGQGQTNNPFGGSFDFSTVKNTIGFMVGFNVNLGIDPTFAFIFSFFLFWIPFFGMLWAIYMALPVIN